MDGRNVWLRRTVWVLWKGRPERVRPRLRPIGLRRVLNMGRSGSRAKRDGLTGRVALSLIVILGVILALAFNGLRVPGNGRCPTRRRGSAI